MGRQGERRRRLMRGAAVVCGFAVALLGGIAPATAADGPAIVVISGRGWGHGVGMAQDGAYWMGRGGATTNRILGQFYPGTALGRATGTVRVVLGKPVPVLTVVAPEGAIVQGVDPAGATRDIAPGAAMSFAAAGSGATWVMPPDGAVVRIGNRGYRGALQLLPTMGGLKVINQLDVEQYLLGMGEVRDPSWPAASLRAQAVAARTYALRAMTLSGEICDDDRCQVYLGQQAEYSAMTKAVSDTRRMVLLYRGGLAATYYSANGGGVTATAAEEFGGDDLPYLRAAPYPTRDPNPWVVKAGSGELASRLSYPGSLTDVTVSAAGPSGRAETVVLDGSAGRMSIGASRFAAKLGLRSTLFTIAIERAAPVAQLPPASPEQTAPTAAPDVARPDLVRVVSSSAVPLNAPAGLGGLPMLPFAGAAAAASVGWAEIARRGARRRRRAPKARVA
jgi:stage II sporulation protein D